MAPTAPANHDPALTPASQSSQALPQNIQPADIPGLQLDQQQIMNLLRSLPGVFTKVSVIITFPSMNMLMSY
jgi:transcriptional regulator CBF1